MAEVAETETAARLPPLGAPALIGEGFRLLRAHAAAMAVLFLVGTAAAVTVEIVARRAGVPFQAADFDPAHLAYEALQSLVAAVVSGLILRSLLSEAPARWRPDAGYAVYVVLVALAPFVAGLLFKLVTAGDDPTDVGSGVIRGLAVVVALAGSAWVLSKLILWPVGRLLGEAAMTPSRSWALMRGATRGYMLAWLLIFLPTVIPYSIMALSLGLDMDDPPAGVIVADAAVTMLWTLAIVAVTAALYRARVHGERLPAAT